jgi:rubrerythrin
VGGVPVAISRRRFIGGAAGAGVLVVAAASGAGLLVADDAPVAISPLGTALRLERLQSAFYAEAASRGVLTGELRDFAETVAAHEAAHVSELTGLLTDPVPEDTYAFGSSTTDEASFAETAAIVEDLAVAAYNGIIPALSGPASRAAARIVSVDARHAAWVRAIMGRDPAEDATDGALTAAQVEAALARTGLIAGVAP